MKVYLMPEFINDLKSPVDLKLVRQVLKHTLDDDGKFITDADDHPYQGIKKAWIRVISKGFRVIYLMYGDSIYLYRAGPHSVENRLMSPRSIDGIPLGTASPTLSLEAITHPSDTGCLLKTTEAVFLNKEILSFYHVGHYEIILVSPFIDPGLLHRRHHFGSFLDRAVEDNTEVTLVTRPPKAEYLGMYKDLEERTIFVYFLAGLHTKLYIFNVDPLKVPEYNKTIQSKVIVGSSNLTGPGFGLDDNPPNYELCYCLPVQKYSEAYEYAKRLINKSMDFRSYELRQGGKYGNTP
jgi:hypothetical protein